MAIPDYQTLMLPLLKVAGDGRVHSMRDVVKGLASALDVSETEQKELLPSGTDKVFYNRARWAKLYLLKAGLLRSAQRGQLQITERGKKVLAENPERVDIAYLGRFPEFLEFRGSSTTKEADESGSSINEPYTPDDLIAKGYLSLREQIEQDLLSKIKTSSPEFFERLVIQLLITMGYGGSLSDAGQAIGKSGDGGVDGVIKEDKLGLDQIYVQAKRWDGSSVGRPEIQRFVGALLGKKSRRGIFLTTSGFTKEAESYADGLDTKIVLVDGIKLTHYMFDYGIGVSTESTYEIKRIDSSFFEEDDSAAPLP